MTERLEPEELLDSFDAEQRRAALSGLAASHEGRLPPAGANLNMHFHSFFSYNAEGWSPSHIAWRSRVEGLYAAGLCDFDVLDGLEEFLAAGRTLALRATVNLETRAYFKEFAEADISSPGEPGVTYIMGAGFARAPRPGSEQERELDRYRIRARERNEALLARINSHLPDIALDYERDVIPLTPSGNATERHIVSAYVRRAISQLRHPDAVCRFWSGVLGTGADETLELMADRPRLEEAVRARLVKRGGPGYEQPSAETFPTVDAFIEWVLACEAVPMITWLDGTSGGERDARAMVSCLMSKGASALNIIPERNWNLSDSAERALKVAKLNEIVAIAEDEGLPINVGTEMNKLGLPFADDFGVDALSPHREAFVRGACIMTGHTLLARYAGFSYVSAAAAAEFPGRKARNAFFEKVGGLPPIGVKQAHMLEDMGEEKALRWFREKVSRPCPLP